AVTIRIAKRHDSTWLRLQGNVRIAVRRDGQMPRGSKIVGSHDGTKSRGKHDPVVAGITGDLSLANHIQRQRCRSGNSNEDGQPNFSLHVSPSPLSLWEGARSEPHRAKPKERVRVSVFA